MNPDHHPSAADAGESLEALDAVGELNAERLQRPRRYWPMIGAMFAIFALMPLAADLLPPLAAILVVPGLIVLIAVVAGRKQPSAVRHIRLRGAMWLPYIGGVLAMGLIGGLNSALYDTRGWWWTPLITAVVMFFICAVGGPALDRYWAGRARYRRD